MTWIYFIVGVVCLIVLQILRTLLSIEFPSYSARAIPQPDAHRFGGLDLIDGKTERLKAHGFSGPAWVGSFKSVDDNEDVTPHATYANDDERVVAWHGPTMEIAHPNQLLTYYTTLLQDGRYVVTQVSDPYFESVADPQTPAQTIAPSDEATELGLHKDFVSNLGVAPSDQPQAAGIIRFAGEHHTAIRSRLLERGHIVESKGVARPSLSYAFGLLRALLSRPKSPQSDTPRISAPQLAYLSGVIGSAKHRAPSQTMQWFLLLLSGVLFVAIGWPLLGMEFTVVILGVIAFHEAGHWAAMRLFGYRNPHITLLPLLGGVTIGYETEPSAAKRAWVAMAGPLPGILLAWLIVYLFDFSFSGFGESNTWVLSAVLVLLFINYLNVLPIPPLDGSHIVQAVLPPRWLVIQILVVLIGVAMGVYVAYLLEFWPLALLGALQLFGLQSLWQSTGLVRRFSESPPPANSNEVVRTAWLLAELEKDLGAPKKPAKRVALADNILTQLDTQPMGGLQRTLVSTVYLALAVVPIGAMALVAASGGAEFDVRPDVAVIDDETEDVYEALYTTADEMDYRTLVEAVADDESPPSPADEDALNEAETHLGQSLPQHLREFYRYSNGLPKNPGLFSVEDIRVADPETFSTGDLLWMVFEGKLYFYSESLGDISIAVEKTQDWWFVGMQDDWMSYLFVDPNAARGEPSVFVIGEDGALAHETIRDLLETAWIDHESMQIYADREERVTAMVEDSMRGMTVVDLLDEFPKLSIFERLATGNYFEAGPASPESLAVAEQRVGQALPADYRQVLEQHNGFQWMAMLPIEEIQPARTIDESSLEWALEVVNEVQPDLMTMQELGACWIIAGHLLEVAADSENFNLYPSLFWCPEQREEHRYLDLSSHSFQRTFSDALRDKAVEINSY